MPTSFPTTRSSFQLADAGCANPVSAAPLTLLQRLDRWLWRQEVKGRERYLAAAADHFDLEQRIRHIDRAGAFWFG